jgi:hypothetical protein
MLLVLNESLQLRKELFQSIEICEIGRQIQQLDGGITAHLFDSLTVTKRGIIHDENRVPLLVWPAMVKKLLDIVLEQGTVCCSLEDCRKKTPS